MMSKKLISSAIVKFACFFIATFFIFSVSFSEEKKPGENKEDTANIEKKEEPKDRLSPTDVIKKYEVEMKAVVTKYKDKTAPEDEEKKNDEIVAKVRGFFDIDELGRLSLGKYWKEITKPQQSDYSETFRKLIERSYVSKSGKLVGDYQVQYAGEDIKGGLAKVQSKVLKDDADVDITYELHLKSDNWMIFNVVVDSTDLVKNYQTSFNNTITKEGFKGLMSRMKSKLVENNK